MQQLEVNRWEVDAELECDVENWVYLSGGRQLYLSNSYATGSTRRTIL